MELFRQGPQAGTGTVDDPQFRGEPHQVAGATEPVVEFPVLSAVQGFVETTDLLQGVAAENSQEDGVRRPRRCVGKVEPAAPEAQV